MTDPTFVAGLRPVPAGVGADEPSVGRPAADIVGVAPNGQRIEVRLGDLDGSIALVFLATRCDGCEEFWRGFGDERRAGLPPSVTPVIVTRGPDTTPATDVERLAAGAGDVPVVMGDDTWTDYRVFGYPFLVLVDAATRTVVAEAVGFGWSDLVGLVGLVGGPER
jgi:hypothetical protein